MKIRNILLIGIAFVLAACAQKGPYVPPNTPQAKLKTISYMPYFGAPVDPSLQQTLSESWSEWWMDVYPGSKWRESRQTSTALLKAGLLKDWSEAEKVFMQVGVMPEETSKKICDALGTDGFLQVVLYSAEAGLAKSHFLSLIKRPGKPSSARMSALLHSCVDGKVVWQATEELNYESGYSHTQMVEYVHNRLSGQMKNISNQ